MQCICEESTKFGSVIVLNEAKKLDIEATPKIQIMAVKGYFA